MKLTSAVLPPDSGPSSSPSSWMKIYMKMGVARYPKGNASFNGDRLPPLYFVSIHCPDERGHVLMCERRHFFDGDCDHLPISLESADDMLVGAYQAYDGITKEKLKQFEHIGYVEDY